MLRLPSLRLGLAAALCLTTTLQAGPLAQFRTILGDIEVELYEDKPVTVANFLKYVRSGAYRDMFFHRWSQTFVLQGGGYRVVDNGDALSIAAVPRMPAITNEFLVGRRFSNVAGTIAMAKAAGNPDSASSEWFFNLVDNSANLDAQNGGFTVFGRVLRGINILNLFNYLPGTNTGLYRINIGSPLNELPALQPMPYTTYADLLFVDISLLEVAVQPATNGMQISWNSVTNRPHVIEFTTNFPPVWRTLVTTNGSGSRQTVRDVSTSGPPKFYRVRVEY